MARIQKAALDYFPMDCVNDDAIKLIEAGFGLEGFAMIIKMYQRIYGTDGYYGMWDDDIILLFSYETRKDRDYILKITQEAIKRNIFDGEMYEKYHILTSRFIQKTYFEASIRKRHIDINEDYLLIGYDELPRSACINGVNVNNNPAEGELNGINVDNNPAESELNGINVDINPQSKVNKKKVNNKKEKKTKREESKTNDGNSGSPPLYEDIELYARQNRYAYTDLKKFYEHYTHKGWPASGWKNVLDKWAKDDEEEYFRKTEEEFRADTEWQSFARVDPPKGYVSSRNK